MAINDGDIVDVERIPYYQVTLPGNEADELVGNTFLNLQNWSKDVLNNAISAIDAISEFTSSIKFTDVGLSLGGETVTIPDLPDPPNKPTISFNNITAPTIPNITIPEGTFSYVDSTYVSSLIDAIKTNLLSIVINGGSGLGEEYETALWERSKARMNDEFDRRRIQTIESIANAGWDIPGGALAAMTQNVENDREHQMDQINRDITTKDAELAHEAWKFATQYGIEIEKLTSDNFNKKQQRALDAAKALTEALTLEFRLQIEHINALIAVYKAQTDIEAIKIDSQTKVYMAEIDGYRGYVGAVADKARAEATVIQANASYNAAISEVLVKQEEAKMQGQINEANLALEKLKSVANVTSALASSLATAMHVSASIGDSVSRTTSNSYGYNTSITNTATLGESHSEGTSDETAP